MNSRYAGDEDTKQTAVQGESKPAWAPSIIARQGKDIYYYVGQEISIYETIDSYGAVMWPAVSVPDRKSMSQTQLFTSREI